MRANRPVCLLAFLAPLAAWPALADGVGPRGGPAPACPDYGSFAVVDPPGGGKGRITAESLPGCPDMASPRPMGSVNIDVMIGNGTTSSGGATSGSQGAGGSAGQIPSGPLPVLHVRPRSR